MWYERRKNPLVREAAPAAVPVVEKTPEQLAEEARLQEERWNELNPLRRWLITFMDETETVVTAHRCSDGDRIDQGRLVFLRTRYGVRAPFGSCYLSEVVYWTPIHLVRSVRMLED